MPDACFTFYVLWKSQGLGRLPGAMGRQRLDWVLRVDGAPAGVGELRPAGRRGPVGRVGDHLAHFGLVVGWVALVPWAEVEDLAAAAVVAAAAAKDLAALEPADEHQRIGRRDVKVLAIHLFLRKLEVRPQPISDRVARLQHPD